jgi:acyl-CoA synthetase (AMP-forming)/AMP-acid ligase II
MGITELFERGADLYPERDCLVDDTGRRSFREVRTRRSRIAAALLASGMQRGERCAIYSSNSSAVIECILAIDRAGGVFVPLNPRDSVSQSTQTVETCEVSTIFYASDYERDIETLRKNSSITRIICLDRVTSIAPALDEWMMADGHLPELVRDRDELVSIYSTGGTTGRPKGVMFTSLTWETAAANYFSSVPCTEPPVYLIVSPITHGAGTVGLVLLAAGATLIIQKHFDAEHIIAAIEIQRVSHLFLPPTAIYMLLDHPRVKQRDYSSLRCFIYMAAPMSVEKLRESIATFGAVMVQFWGQTEAPCFCTCLTVEDHLAPADMLPARLKSCGRPTLLTSVEVMDDEGRILPVGERGELVVRSNLVMKGYYNNPEETEDAFRFGWHHTGDIGTKDTDGFVYIVDRKKDMIITGGFNVYPSEVEQIIWAHPAVQDCAVIGVPDDKWGEAIKAVVELKHGCSVPEDQMIAYLKNTLGSVRSPKTVEFWDDLPRTPVGKVDKKRIRARYWQGRDRAI